MSLPERRVSDRPVAAEEFPPGTVIAERYRIVGVLGTGSSGRVYAAEHVLLRKRVALKLLYKELLDVPTLLARFEREAIAAGRIEHPNVAAALDFGKLPDGRLFLVLEQIVGRNLRDEVQRGALGLVRSLHIARQIASAVARAQTLGIVHRDLKPDNVMLVEKGPDHDFVKILDFGIARLPPTGDAGAAPLTQAGAVFGTPEYMAPEQALGQPVDSRADLYALGVMLFEMIAGVRPFDINGNSGLANLISTPPPSFAARVAGLSVPPAVEACVQRLLAKNPDQRYARASEVVEQLGELLTQVGGRAAMLTPAPSQSAAFDVAAPALPPEQLVDDMAPTVAPSSAAAAELRGRVATFLPSDPLPAFELPGETAARAAKALPPISSVPPKPPSVLPPVPEPPTLLRAPSSEPPSGEVPSHPAQPAAPAAPRGSQSMPQGLVALRGSLLQVTHRVAAGARSSLAAASSFVDAQRPAFPAPVRKALAKFSSSALVLTALGLGLVLLVSVPWLLATRRAAVTPAASASAAPSVVPLPPVPVASEAPAPADSGPEGESWSRARNLLEQARLQSLNRRDAEAAFSLARALEIHPSLRGDARVAPVVFQAAQSNSKEASDTAFALLQGPLGTRGAELSYRLAMAKNTREASRRRAEKWLQSDAFRAVAGADLVSAVKLRFAESCEQKRNFMQEAARVGGENTLQYLRELSVDHGCGISGQEDCFACLRADNKLAEAIEQVERRVKAR